VNYTLVNKLTNDFCILEKFVKKKDLSEKMKNSKFIIEETEFMTLNFAFNDEIKCHYESEIKSYPLKALMNEDHDIVFD
jgi:hypothetical protein